MIEQESRNLPISAVGRIFNIQRFSIHDGPGIRTTVFFKGCNLHCFWCHNPESIAPQKQLLLYPDKCIGCGACLTVCSRGCHQLQDGRKLFHREDCQACGSCAQQCYAQALVLSGEDRTSQEVLDIVLRDRTFYQESGGGVTFSGGEPMLQPDFLLELLKSCRAEKIHTAVDTAGNVPFSLYEKVIPYTDLFLYDIKSPNPDGYRKATGGDGEKIYSNLHRLVQAGKEIWVRVPVIPGFNDSASAMAGIGERILASGHRGPVELMPFHKLGSGKYNSLGEVYAAQKLDPPSVGQLEQLRELLQDMGLSLRGGE